MPKRKENRSYAGKICTAGGRAILLVLVTALSAIAADEFRTEEEKTLYAVGLSLGRSLFTFSLTPAELDIVKQGLDASVTGKNKAVELDAYNGRIQDLARTRRKARGDSLAPQNRAALERAAAEAGAIRTESGLVYIAIKEGAGKGPAATDTVRVNYRGTLPDGQEFDSSARRGKPLEFKLTGVIKCWTEGLQMMRQGGRSKLVCPAPLAYGDTGAGEMILPGATLVFEIDLLEVKRQ